MACAESDQRFQKTTSTLHAKGPSELMGLTFRHVCVKISRLRVKKNVSISMIQGDSVARGPKLLSIKNYVIEIMT